MIKKVVTLFLAALLLATTAWGADKHTFQGGINGVTGVFTGSVTAPTMGIEGTWTPAVVSRAGTLTTVGAVSGTYRKIGNLVTLTFSVAITTNGTGSTSILISGIPYPIPAYVVGYGTERSVTGNMIKVESYISSPTDTLEVKYYDNTYPSADGVLLVGLVTYPL